MTTTPRIPRNHLVAVFDESGATSTPGEDIGDDFTLAAVIVAGERAAANIRVLDEKLQQLTGRQDYKYRQVRQNTEARRSVVHAFRRQSSLIRIFGYYAAGGALVNQAQRELEAVQASGGDIPDAIENLNRLKSDPRRESLRDVVQTSIPALSAWAGTQRKRVSVYFDQRNDLATIADDLKQAMILGATTQVWGDAYDWLDWQGRCPEHLEALARVADVFAGDIRATFKSKGNEVWKQVQPHGFVGRHAEVARTADSFWAGLVPVPRVGYVADHVWDQDWESGSTTTTMFAGYQPYMLTGRVSLFSPCGRGCMLTRRGDGYDVFQTMD